MLEQRERARRLATSIVSWSLAVAGVALVALAVVLVVRSGPAMLLLSILVGLLGLGLAFAGFFFQLVPMRVDELAEEKRDYDRRQGQR